MSLSKEVEPLAAAFDDDDKDAALPPLVVDYAQVFLSELAKQAREAVLQSTLDRKKPLPKTVSITVTDYWYTLPTHKRKAILKLMLKMNPGLPDDVFTSEGKTITMKMPIR